ncbi:MAG: Eco57I restriction-modification methylase domain-containing protein [Pirellula sp.]
MIDIARIRRLIKGFDFDGLFEELGWDRFRRTLPTVVDGIEYQLTGIREKRGFQVFHYLVPNGKEFPTSEVMTKIQRAVAKSAHENIVVFSDESKSQQCYRIAKREDGKLLRSTGLDFHEGHSGEALAQRLSKLAISLEEEENIELVDVAKRASELFAERATKRFFTEFQRQRETFLTFIKGIKDVQQREWYSSLMLNRLMFVYFVQKKGFLDHDLDYLRNRLKRTQETKKAFHEFYRYFLIRLFHDGLNKREADRTDPELETLLGKVPYLNGGIFDQHQIEIENTEIKIPDKAFEGLFDFFDQYTWHLDDRPLRNDQEINPDVLGYIFEKYINQKQMGAYYTKEDITEYISKNTIIPYLFEEAARRNTEPFRPEREVWQLLRDDPDRYIYDAVGHGVFVNLQTGEELESPVALPENIAAGIDDVSKRAEWNSGAPSEVALPTETWREHIARRQRCMDLRQKLASGEVTSINDMITYNLDIRQFAQDVIDNCESPDLLRAIYYTIAGRPSQVGSNHKPQLPMSVLDPTCGSGAFLFAALNIMQPLYEACLTKMEQFIIEVDRAQPVTVDDEVAALIELGESSTLEFKSTARFCIKLSQSIDQVPKDKQDEKWKAADKDRQHDILKAVSALLNTNGGDLVIGVDDNGVGFGIHHDYKFLGAQAKQNRDGYELWMNDLFIKQFGKVAAGCIEPVFAKRDGVDVVWLKITPSPDPVFVNSDEFYRRIGNSSQSLSKMEFAKYRDQRFKGEPPPRKEPKLKVGARQKADGKKLKEFRDILAEVAKHPNRTYFVLKSIIINNLFGVDIMPEAVEICKLRLFLKLMSTVEPHYAKDNLGVEALPDIDFNIRPGNTLVGYTTLDQIKSSYQSRYGLLDSSELKSIEKQVKIVSLNFEMFRRQQTELDGQVKESDKKALRKELRTLTEELDEFLAGDYGVEPKKASSYREWKNSHKPFHWFAEFYGICANGGFSIVIGNPPYIECSKVRSIYELKGFSTIACGNLYALATERSYALLSDQGRFGFIVQAPIVSTSRMQSVRELMNRRSGFIWYSTYDDRPAKLFEHINHCRVAIVMARHDKSCITRQTYTTRYHKWYADERPVLFKMLTYLLIENQRDGDFVPKFRSQTELGAYRKILQQPQAVSSLMRPHDTEWRIYYKITGVGHWFTFTLYPPRFWRDGEEQRSSREDSVSFSSELDRDTVFCCLCSSTHYWLYQARTNCRDFNPSDLRFMPISQAMHDGVASFSLLAKEIMTVLETTSETGSGTYTVGGSVEYQKFRPKTAKSLVDKVDHILSKEFGLTDEESDFIVNYDIKYRLGGQDE